MKRISRNCLVLGSILAAGLSLAGAASADDFAAGFQFAAPFAGLSVKIPVSETMILQPIISAHNDGGTSKYTVGGRLLFDLKERNNIGRYWAVGVGRHSDEDVEETAAMISLGGEIRSPKVFGAPSFEMGLYTREKDGPKATDWGTAINVGWHFRF